MAKVPTVRRSRALRWTGVAGLGLLVAGAVVAAIGGGVPGRRSTVPRSALSSPALPPGRGADAVGGVTTPAGTGLSAASPGSSGQSGTGRAAGPLPATTGSGTTGAATGGGTSPDLPANLGQPQVVRTGDISLEVKKGGFQAAFDRANALAQAMGGFVVNSTIGAPVSPPEGVDPSIVQAGPTGPTPASSGPTAGTLELRIPGNRFDEARAAIEGVGTKIVQETLSGQDVGGQVVDLDARIANLQAEEDALRAIEAKATSTTDILAIQPQLVQVRTEIEQLQGEHARLDNSVALASLRVTLAEPEAATITPLTPRPPARLAHSWHEALAAVQAVTGGVLIVLGYLLPLTALVLLGWGAATALMRRRRPRPYAADPV
jgi:Domain of unknown function (DUF4349)